MVLVSHKVQLQLAVIVALGLLHSLFLPVAIVADVVGGAGVVTSVTGPVKLSDRLTRAA